MQRKVSMVVLAVAMFVTAATSALAAGQGWLGVTTQSTDADLRRGLDLTRDGLLVNNVSEDSPADRAGLRKGDVILSYNSRSVTEPSELRNLVRNTEPGNTVSLSVWRDGSRRSIDVRVGEVPSGDDETFEMPVPPTPPSAPSAPDAPRAPRAPHGEDDGTVHRKMIINGRELSEDEMDEKMKDLDGEHFFSPKDMKEFKELKDLKDMPGMQGWSGDGGRTFTFNSTGRGRLGVRVERLSDDLAQALGMSGDEGVLVVQVLEDTPAQKAGLRAGDVIVRVDGDAVSDPDGLVKVLGASDGSVDLVVVRKGVRRTIQAELERGTTPRAWSMTPAPNARPRRFDVRIPEPGRSPQVYRRRAKDDTENQDLREELRQLRRELQDLRREMGERK